MVNTEHCFELMIHNINAILLGEFPDKCCINQLRADLLLLFHNPMDVCYVPKEKHWNVF